MNNNAKLCLMFAPLILFFAGFAVMVNDMRNPAIVEDQCVVTATGNDVQPYKNAGHFIYRQSNNAKTDVSLRCDRLGTLLLNDTQLFQTPVKSGQDAKVARKRYQFLPERWMVSVHTGH